MVTSYIQSEKPKQKYLRLYQALTLERSSFDDHYKTISSYISPTRSRFFSNDQNKGTRRNDKINDNTVVIARRVLSSGMMAGMTNPATRWFRLTVEDPQLAEDEQVKEWLEAVEESMHETMLRTNLYTSFAQQYGDEADYGTSPMYVEEDARNIFRTEVFPCGSYWISEDARHKVNLFYHVFRLTVRQLVEEYGRDPETGEIDWTNISTYVHDQWDNEKGGREQWVEIHHVIMPNDEHRPNRMEAKYKRYKSCTFEVSAANSSGYGTQVGATEDDKILRESGYDYFPVLVARWDVAAGDIYATNCPGMTALGDVKQLQLGERRLMQAIDKLVSPPMLASEGLQQSILSTLPSGISWLPTREMQSEGFKPAYQVDPKVQELEYKQEQCRRRINDAYHKNTFLMFSDDPKAQPITAAEVAARQSEKMLQLSPVLERHSQDIYDPLIKIVYYLMDRAFQIPPKPPQLEGAGLKIRYESVMAQAQKAAWIGAIDRFVNLLLMLAKDYPAIFDKVNMDQLVDEYADRSGVPRKIIYDDDRVAAMRQEMAAAREEDARAQMIPSGAKAIKDLSQADTTGDNALAKILESVKASQGRQVA